jgi:hypothetical protein
MKNIQLLDLSDNPNFISFTNFNFLENLEVIILQNINMKVC